MGFCYISTKIKKTLIQNRHTDNRYNFSQVQFKNMHIYMTCKNKKDEQNLPLSGTIVELCLKVLKKKVKDLIVEERFMQDLHRLTCKGP